ncbi:MAG: DUF1761 domain-containing protein [Anaerolineaceae bacterium]|nr:DUF1761 domain-containing protein [Anaerolineaceae bacterium]
MDFSLINWLAVIACVIASMVSGSLWYNPRTFFPIWWKGIGKTDAEPGMEGNMALTWGLTILSSLVQAIGVALMVNWLGPIFGGVNALSGLLIGLVLWLLFVAPTNLVNKLFAGHGLKIWAIEAGNHLLNFLLFGLILGAWR